MIVDQEELNRRLSSARNLANSLDRSCVAPSNTGRRESPPASPATKRAPVVVRATAGALALQSSVPQVAKEFHLSENTVREATHAHNPDVRGRVEGALEKVRDLAIEKTMESIGLLTPEKLGKSGARDLSVVAANMSRVIDNVSPKQVGGNVTLVLYTPQAQRVEADFEVVEV